jgi:ABC-type glycerol-3-phosphate transport system permease component
MTVVTLLLWLCPILVLVTLSFHRTGALIATPPLTVMLSPPDGVNYRSLGGDAELGSALYNSIMLATFATLLCVIATFPAAYYTALIARDVTPRGFFAWLLSTRMIPPSAIIVPFLLFAHALLLNRHLIGIAVIIAATQVPIAAWLFRQTLAELPMSLCDALRVDGAGEHRILWHVVLPLASRGLATAVLFVFVFSWNEYLLTSVLIDDPRLKTLPLLTAGFITGYQIDWGPMLAAVTIMLIPPMLVSLILDRSVRAIFTATDDQR